MRPLPLHRPTNKHTNTNTHKLKYANTQTRKHKDTNKTHKQEVFLKENALLGKETNVWAVALHRRGQQGRENIAHCIL